MRIGISKLMNRCALTSQRCFLGFCATRRRPWCISGLHGRHSSSVTGMALSAPWGQTLSGAVFPYPPTLMPLCEVIPVGFANCSYVKGSFCNLCLCLSHCYPNTCILFRISVVHCILGYSSLDCIWWGQPEVL